MKNLYIVISQTETGFAKKLRRFGHIEYNHASIGLDKDLKELYAFARQEQYGYFTAKLVYESTDRFLVGKRESDYVPIKIFELPVTEEQYDWVKNCINEVMNDPEYRYNLYSVITYPLTKGFETYKSYSCIEFVMHVLKEIGYEVNEPLPSYQPDDLREFLAEYEIYEGDLLEYMPEHTTSEAYFKSMSPGLVKDNAKCFCITTYRSLGTFKDFIKSKIV